MVDLYFKAARDGNLNILKNATKRDTNRRDEDYMTPVHYAASCGNVEALRLLVGKGGDPDKTNCDGSTAVHLAAGCGQLNCLSFLTNFGANIWALDNEGHTPLEEAAIHGRMDCVRHLDGLVAIQMLRNKKETERLKRRAKSEAIRRMRKQSKMQQEREKAYEKRVQRETKNGKNSAEMNELKASKVYSVSDWDVQSSRSGYMNGSNRPRNFSDLAGVSASEDTLDDIDTRSTLSHALSDTFTGKSKFLGRIRTKMSTLGRKSNRQENGNVILMRNSSKSEPNVSKIGRGQKSNGFGQYNETPVMLSHRPLATNSVTDPQSEPDSDDSFDETNSVGHITKKYDDKGNVTTEIQYIKRAKSNGSITSRNSRNSQASFSQQSQGTYNDFGSLHSAGFDDYSSDVLAESTEMKGVVTFLASLNLEQFTASILKESIDLSALLLCDDKDLQSVGLPLGPRRKIMEAIKRRNLVLKNPGQMKDSRI
ncbi:Usher syndrome type-1G protein homolog [Nematostella vectensis]|uniref:Usher syndrome type-1G protein homolog n=1 Tax=Nematostella vectensis TaxID=45351 RepID=UPI0020774995|nr:Usher syndrome type-1G protein homolog [Nematostella vectensis]